MSDSAPNDGIVTPVLPPDPEVSSPALVTAPSVDPSTGLLPDGSHPATPGITPLYSAPAPREAPTKATKAVWGAITGGVVAGATSVETQISAGVDPLSWQLWLNAIIAGCVGAGLTTGVVYGVANKPK